MRTTTLFALAVMASLCTACSPERSVKFRVLSAPDEAKAVATEDRLAIRLGTAAAIEVTAVLDGEPVGLPVELISNNPDVLGLGLSTSDDRTFVMYGVAAGSATVSAYVDGDAIGDLDASVTIQPAR